jgi:hypothetical protein
MRRRPMCWRFPPRSTGRAKFISHCGGLAVCDHLTKAGLVMESAWLPTQEELSRLVAGAPVILGVMGLGHPPVYLAVGEPPDETPPDAR